MAVAGPTPDGDRGHGAKLRAWTTTTESCSRARSSGREQRWHRTLADYRDQGVVLNIWATWCVPCLAEMPALNRLSALVKDFAISVLPVSIDVKGLAVVRPYYAAHGIENLPILLDPDGRVADAFKIDGIPASFIVDRRGRLVARCLGAAEWDAPGAVATIRRLTSGGNQPI